MTDALDVRHLTVRYAETTALEDVSLVLGRGEACGLVGQNGSGKSTLFKAVLGLVRPEHGSIRMLGTEPSAARSAGLVAYVPQADDLDRDFPLTVADVVRTGRHHRMGVLRRPRPADHDAVAVALARAGLTALADRPLAALSGGQRQRVLLARALAQGARLFLLDEPFTGVDRGSQDALVGVLRSLVAEGCSVLLSTHDLSMLPDLCTRSVLLHQRVLAAGPTAQVLTPENLARTFGLAGSGTGPDGPAHGGGAR